MSKILNYQDEAQTKIVRWDMEDPSEFRPDLGNMGKDQSSFRTFYDVRTS